MAILLGLLLVIVLIVILLSRRKPRPSQPLQQSNPSTEINVSAAIIQTDDNDLASVHLEMKKSDDWIEIKSLRFYGFVNHCSANGLYSVASQDRIIQKTKTLNGALVLFTDDKIIYHKRFQRPNDAKVADNGIVILCDWLHTKETAGVFYALNSKGQTIIKHRFKAHILGTAISPSGHYALCSTAISDYEPHSKVTYLFDLQSSKVLNVIKESAQMLSIDESVRLIHFNPSKHHLIYSFDGECIQGFDPSNPNWYEHCNGYDLYTTYNQELENFESKFTTFEEYQPYIAHFKEAISRIPSNNWKANIHLKIGDIYAKFKLVDEAKASYQAATVENPKAPVTRRLQRLYKMT